MVTNRLIDAEDSTLVVIDVQAAFIGKLVVDARAPLLEHICWLIGVANWLSIPTIVTAEDIDVLGSIEPAVSDVLVLGTDIHNKMSFGLVDEPSIIGAIESTGRSTCVLVGLETDVCVAHSALGLLQRGYQVVAVADASQSPGTAHQMGLERMRAAGVVVVRARNLFYEWVRTVAAAKRFRTAHPHLAEPSDL